MLVMPNGKPSVADFQAWAKSQFGREATGDELGGFASKAGITDENNISEDQFGKAKQYATEYAATLGAKPSGGQPPPTQGGQTIPTTGSGQTVTGVPPAYQAQQMTQFQPNQQLQGQRNSLMSAILSNPQTMGQQWQDQMFEGQKELQSSMAKQLGNEGRQRLQSRGFGASGNQANVLQGQIDQNMMSELLRGRRDIATQANQQNRQDELNALSAALAQQGGDIDAFQALLSGQQAQAGENRFANQSQMGNAQFDFMQRDQDRARLLQEYLGRTGSELERDRFGEQKNQFQQGHLLDILRFLEGKNQFGQTFGEGQRQFNNQMGFNWAGLQSSDMNNLLRLFQNLGM